MNMDSLTTQLKRLEEKFKKAKCNKCAERILNKARIVKRQIECLKKKESI